MHTNSSIIMALAIALILTTSILVFTLTDQAFAQMLDFGALPPDWQVGAGSINAGGQGPALSAGNGAGSINAGGQGPALSAGNGVGSIHELFVNTLGSQQPEDNDAGSGTSCPPPPCITTPIGCGCPFGLPGAINNR